MTDLQTKLQELRELVESKTKECPILVDAIFSGINDTRKVAELRVAHQNCPRCHGTGRIPDPAYAALLEVVRFPCSDRGETLCPIEMGVSKVHKPCKNTGYITRSWEGLPEGALIKLLEIFYYSLSTGPYLSSGCEG